MILITTLFTVLVDTVVKYESGLAAGLAYCMVKLWQR
jgi:hypothetical protein